MAVARRVRRRRPGPTGTAADGDHGHVALPSSLPVLLPNGRRLDAAVRISARARHARIRIDAAGGVELVAPIGMRRREARAALASRAGWIAARIAEAARRRERAGILGLDRPGVAWLGGRALAIRRVGGARAVARRVQDELLVAGAEAAGAEAAIERWYRRTALRAIEAAIAEEGARLGLAPGRVSVRDPRSRWGSCSSSGTVSFSWRLVMAPEPVLRYVVIHELVHLREPNHSPRFWHALSAALPGWRDQADWLRDHGDEVQRFRPRLGP